ncbi:MAG: hypothetical protein KA138_04805, partial [Saprospiraceae bacterium]|nr:hypothetical protein [Saprospiraceae bacterium]
MKRIITFISFFIFSVSPTWAQTPKENLEKAVEIYNANREYADVLQPKTLTDEHVKIVKSRTDQGIALLDKVIQEGNADQLKVARYFKTNFLYSYFFILGMKGQNAEAYELNKQFEADITRYSSIDFPMSYDYFDKKYSIKWDNFSLTQAEYFTGAGEICYNLGKYPDALRFAKFALDHPAVSSYLRYIAVNKILDVGVKNPALLSETERQDYALKSIQLYESQDEEEKKVINENKYPTVKRGSVILVNASETDNSATHQARCATAAPIAAKYSDAKEYALKLFAYCYKNKYVGSEDFHNAALQLSRSSFIGGDPATRLNAQTIGDAALTALVAKVSINECEKFKQYAGAYQAIGLASKGQGLEKRAINCVEAREETARKAEAERRKQARRANRNFNVYLGLDIIPLITSVEKMDFGGHLDLRGKRVAHSFGFSLVKLRKDYNSSRTKWDGNRYFYTFKVFSKKGNTPTYTGLYFGYADKTFENLR